jgi:Uma2 family endonuclease
MLELMQDALPQNIRGLRRVEYDAMVLAGILYDTRVELLDGQLVTKVTTSPRHSLLTSRLMEMLYPRLRRDMRVRVNMPFAANDDSEPEPDLAVVLRADTEESHPERAFLAIEVCYSSSHNDRVIKPRLYAGAGIPEYWVVDVEKKLIEVYTQPRAGRYGTKRIIERGTLTPIELPDAHIDLAALFT